MKKSIDEQMQRLERIKKGLMWGFGGIAAIGPFLSTLIAMPTMPPSQSLIVVIATSVAFGLTGLIGGVACGMALDNKIEKLYFAKQIEKCKEMQKEKAEIEKQQKPVFVSKLKEMESKAKVKEEESQQVENEPER